MRFSCLGGVQPVLLMHQQRSLPILPGAVFSAQEVIYYFGHSSHHQINDRCDRGEYVRLEHGIFMLAGKELTLEAALTFCARRHPCLHVGGKTALVWRGLIPASGTQDAVMMYGPTGSALPEWVTKRFPIRFSNRCPFDQELPRQAGLEALPDQPLGIPVSIPERALIEYLDQEGTVGGQMTIESVRRVMATMGGLQSDVLASLLKHCFRPRILRMCVIWAEEFKLPWLRVAREAMPKNLPHRPNAIVLPDASGKKRWIKPPNSTAVVRQTNELANAFLEMMGKKYRAGYRFDLADEPQEVLCWKMACSAQKILLATEVEDAVVATRLGNTAQRRRFAEKRKAQVPIERETGADVAG